MGSQYPISRNENLVIQELKDEVLIYDLKINKALCLNQTCGLVWNLCDGTKSVSEIQQTVSRKLKSQVQEEIIWLALERLSEQNLLASEINSQHLYQGMSRREVIRKIGIASAVSLPIISSITAPHAIHAQSNCLRLHGCPCQSDLDCAEDAVCNSNICDCLCLNLGCCACDPNSNCVEAPTCPCLGQCACECDPQSGPCEQCSCTGQCDCECDPFVEGCS